MSPLPEAPRFDTVRVSVTVGADQATAFAVFTGETDLWWRRGPKFRVSGRQPGLINFELGMNGRLMDHRDGDRPAGGGDGPGYCLGAAGAIRIRVAWSQLRRE